MSEQLCSQQKWWSVNNIWQGWLSLDDKWWNRQKDTIWVSEEAKRKMMIDVQSLCIRAIMLIHSFPFSIAFVPFHSSKEAPIVNHTYNNNKNEVTVFSYEGSPPHPSASCPPTSARLPSQEGSISTGKISISKKRLSRPKRDWPCSSLERWQWCFPLRRVVSRAWRRWIVITLRSLLIAIDGYLGGIGLIVEVDCGVLSFEGGTQEVKVKLV